MGFRMRKSIKIAPGVRLNVSKTGLGASAGIGGARYSVHSTGRRTVSARTGIPGITYQESVRGGRRRAAARPASPPVAPLAPAKLGLFAPKGEKQLYKAIKRVGDDHPDFRLASYSLAGLMLLTNGGEEATRLLSEAFATGRDPAEDKFVSKYLYT